MKRKPYARLIELIEGSIENGYSPKPVNNETGRWVLGLGALTPKGLNLSEKKSVALDDTKFQNRLLKEGDFLVSRSNTREKVGQASLYKGGLSNCIYPDLMMRFRINKSLTTIDYIDHYLRSPITQNYFASRAAGSNLSMVKITKSILAELPIYHPSLQEQKAIAAILSTWDEAIEKTEQLIELKEQQFRNLQKKLIKNCFRSGSDVKLGDVARIPTKQKLVNLEGKRLLTVKLHCMGIEANDRIKPKLSETGRPYYSRKAGEILIGRQNFHNGGIGIVPENLDGGIASNAITSIEGIPGKLHQKFLYWVFSRENYYQKIGHIMDGTGQKELSDKQLLNLSIYLPAYPQQIAISNALDNAKEEFRLIANICEKLLLQKQGLMQTLLTGKWKVNFKEEK